MDTGEKRFSHIHAWILHGGINPVCFTSLILRAGVVEDAEVPGSQHQEAERWIVHLVRCIPILGMPTGDANW